MTPLSVSFLKSCDRYYPSYQICHANFPVNPDASVYNAETVLFWFFARCCQKFKSLPVRGTTERYCCHPADQTVPHTESIYNIVFRSKSAKELR